MTEMSELTEAVRALTAAITALLESQQPMYSRFDGLVPMPNDRDGAVGFLQSLRVLKTWSGLTLREVCRNSQQAGNYRVAVSSLGDALNPRNTRLPSGLLVAALTQACGLTQEQRYAWLVARDRLDQRNGQRGSVPH